VVGGRRRRLHGPTDQIKNAAAEEVADRELNFLDLLDRVKEVACDIEERVHHAPDFETNTDARRSSLEK
jgi:hypothetical protein